MIGGLISSMLLKLVVLPAIYRWFDPGPPTPHDPGSGEDVHPGRQPAAG